VALAVTVTVTHKGCVGTHMMALMPVSCCAAGMMVDIAS
jgi:hypothetical protein